MERILIFNGISPYLYSAAVILATQAGEDSYFAVFLIIFLIQLLITVVISIICKDKRRLAKITMINKLIQIPYYIGFFIVAVCGVLVFMGLMGIGLLFLPVFIAIDLGVFLSTLIPQEICTIKLLKDGRISVPKFLLYLTGNAFYVIDVILSVLIFQEYKKPFTQTTAGPLTPQG